MPARSSSSAPRGVARYRPGLDRLVFFLALLGILVTVHLWIQQGRGFDRGCLGFSAPAAVTADCELVTGSEASTLFGVSNAVWGVLFYVLVAALTAVAARAGAAWEGRLKYTRTALIAGGFVYSLYLFYYQLVELGTFCVLCTVSAAIAPAK